MVGIVKDTFTHDNVDYEVHMWIKDEIINVQTLIKSTKKPADGYIYSVKLEDQVDSTVLDSFLDPISSLVEAAKGSVVSGTWKSYQKALQEIKDEEEKKKKQQSGK